MPVLDLAIVPAPFLRTAAPTPTCCTGASRLFPPKDLLCAGLIFHPAIQKCLANENPLDAAMVRALIGGRWRKSCCLALPMVLNTPLTATQPRSSARGSLRS